MDTRMATTVATEEEAVVATVETTTTTTSEDTTKMRRASLSSRKMAMTHTLITTPQRDTKTLQEENTVAAEAENSAVANSVVTEASEVAIVEANSAVANSVEAEAASEVATVPGLQKSIEMQVK